MAKYQKYGFLTKEFLQEEYVNTGLTDTEFCDKWNINGGPAVKYWREKFDIVSNKKNQGYDLTGMKFGKLLVIKERHRANKRIYWTCHCECGKEIIRNSAYLKANIKHSCGCFPYPIGEKHHQWSGYKKLSGSYWKSIKSNASNRNLEWNLEIEKTYELLEKQNFKCALSGLDIVPGENVSLDRINPLDGYNPKNIRWTHKDINIMKWEYNDDQFFKLCNLVVNNSEEDGSAELIECTTGKWKRCGNISFDRWFNIKYNAKARNMSFEISIEDGWELFKQQKGKCAISGLPIVFVKNATRNDRYNFTASLDRKDSSIGYISTNLWWVHKEINNIKWKFDLYYFFDLCNKITDYKKNMEIV